METIFIDNQPYEVEDGQNLLKACLSLGFDIPYFCWHPALNSVGSCRQCAVKQFRDENDTRGRIVMSCMTPACGGVRISIDDPEVKRFRASVIQWLMLNHPHDCPVCDEGGECHLQDMAVMTGHVYRKTRFKKRTYRNQDLGPFLHHEMNRCIQCYRCVRFYRDYAGGRDLNVFGVHQRIYFGRSDNGTLENEFSGNLVEVCPTGVFTDRTLRSHYTRKWDLQTAPSICVHCSLGCNTIPGERYGTLRRILNRYHGDVNGYFLCDRGRFGYEFVNSVRRIRSPLWRSRTTGAQEPTTRDQALRVVKSMLEHSSGIVGIGSPRASLEANYALREFVGPDNFATGMAAFEQDLVSTVLAILQEGPARAASLRDVAHADAVLILGEDLTNTAPMLALCARQSVLQAAIPFVDKLQIPRWSDAAMRDAIHGRLGPLYVATACPTKLDDVATGKFRGAPDEIARLGFAVAQAVSNAAPKLADPDGNIESLAGIIANRLKHAKRPLIISGVSSQNREIPLSAANVAWALCSEGLPAQLAFVLPECNSAGLGLMMGLSLERLVGKLESGEADTLIVLENDLYSRANEKAAENLFENARNIIVVDHLMHGTAQRADVVLPAGTFAESDGTLVNNECRSQRYFEVFPGPGEIQGSWQWIRDIMLEMGRSRATDWSSLDRITADLARDVAAFNGILDAAFPATHRICGQKVPRESHRFSGRTAMAAQVDVHEDAPPDDRDSALSFSMEGYQGMPPSSLIPRYWAPRWNSVQALNKFQAEVAGDLIGGNPGRRLIEPSESGGRAFFREIPEPFQPRSGELFVVPGFHIFGSEELSAHSPSIASRIPEPYVGLNADDAETLGLTDGVLARISVEGFSGRLKVRVIAGLRQGVAVLPAGLKEPTRIELSGWARISRAEGS